MYGPIGFLLYSICNRPSNPSRLIGLVSESLRETLQIGKHNFIPSNSTAHLSSLFCREGSTISWNVEEKFIPCVFVNFQMIWQISLHIGSNSHATNVALNKFGHFLQTIISTKILPNHIIKQLILWQLHLNYFHIESYFFDIAATCSPKNSWTTNISKSNYNTSKCYKLIS